MIPNLSSKVIKLRDLVLLLNLKCVPIVKPKGTKLFQEETRAGSNCQVLKATEIPIFRLITRCCHLKKIISRPKQYISMEFGLIFIV